MSRIKTAQGPVEIRELHTIQEMEAAEQIQRQVWGAGTNATPKELLIAAQYEGGLLAGAFASGLSSIDASTVSTGMIGLVFSFPTRDPAAHHSHLLATLEAWRGQGIGTHLKWFQRDWCLVHGVTLVRWTVDPLRAANAAINIQHLGGTAATYFPNYYGEMQGIDAGVPTDRLLLEWHLLDTHVVARARGEVEDHGFPDVEPSNQVQGDHCSNPNLGLTCPRVRLNLPENFIQLSKTAPELALEWRLKTRELFTHYFGRGYRITGFTRAGGPAYLLEKEPL